MVHELTMQQYRIDATTYTPDVFNLFHLLEGRKPQDFEFTTPSTTLSVTGRSTVPVDPDYDRLAAAIQRGAQRANRDGRRVNHNANHNVVDINRITAGVDVRTTVSEFCSSFSSFLLNFARSCSATSRTAWIKPF